MFHHLDDVVIIATGIAAFLISVGVIWRYIVRPIHQILSTLRDHWDYLNDQLANGNHNGTLREQVNRIDERQVVVRQKQEQQAQAIAAVQAQVRQVAATTAQTHVAVHAVKEAVTHPDYHTGEIPVTPRDTT